MAHQIMNQQHFVLVHGACHGAWCWYKLKPLLESAGHRVTALDMDASGKEPGEIQKLSSFEGYNIPLLELMEVLADEKVILVGHNLGGINVALAADTFSDRVAAVVFVAAFMPDTMHAPSYPLEMYGELTPLEMWMDTEFELSSSGGPKKPITLMTFGPRFLASKLYHHSSKQDAELAESLIRPSSVFGDDLAKLKPLSKRDYGGVKKGYIKIKDDRVMPIEFESWMVKNGGVSVVKEIVLADHMAMISSPYELSVALQQVVHALLFN